MTGDWRAALKADPTNWLLEEENPSVRYFTLKDILDRPENDTASDARRSIMQTGSRPRCHREQREPSYLQAYPRF